MKEIPKNTPLRDIPFAAFDFETTGMNPFHDKIVEVGVTLFQKNTVLKTFHALVQPGIPVPSEVVAIHGINDEMLKDKPPLEKILPELLSILSLGMPLAHNASFDFSFLVEAAGKENAPLPSGSVVDTCALSRAFLPMLRSHRLEFLVQHFQIITEKSHRALSDSHSCFSLFGKLVELLPLQWETPWETFRRTEPGILSAEFNEENIPETLAPVQEAMLERRRFSMTYRSREREVTNREVTPIGFSSERQRPVLIAYCHLRQSTRTFRLDRILQVEELGTPH